MTVTLEILNQIRDSASQEYQTRIPEATRTNITQIGNSFEMYTAGKEEFLDLLIGKIVKTIINMKMFQNPLARFKKGDMEYGNDIEEIFVEMAKAIPFDKTGANPFDKTMPVVQVMYHRKNREDTYPITVSDVQLRKAFRSVEGVSNLINAIIQSVYKADNYDEYIMTKELIGSYPFNDSAIYEVPAMTSQANAQTFLKTVRKASLDMTFLNKKLNAKGVMNSTEAGNQVLLVNKDILATIDVDVLSKSFNIGKTNIQVEVIPLDDFGSATDIYGVLCDKDWFVIYDTLYTMENLRNGKGLYTNYWLHHHQLQSLSKFTQAVVFKKKAVA